MNKWLGGAGFLLLTSVYAMHNEGHESQDRLFQDTLFGDEDLSQLNENDRRDRMREAGFKFNRDSDKNGKSWIPFFGKGKSKK